MAGKTASVIMQTRPKGLSSRTLALHLRSITRASHAIVLGDLFDLRSDVNFGFVYGKLTSELLFDANPRVDRPTP